MLCRLLLTTLVTVYRNQSHNSLYTTQVKWNVQFYIGLPALFTDSKTPGKTKHTLTQWVDYTSGSGDGTIANIGSIIQIMALRGKGRMERNRYSSNGPPRENKNGKTKLTRTRLIVFLTIFGPSSGKSEKGRKVIIMT